MFADKFWVLWSYTSGVSIVGDIVVALWGPGAGFFGVSWSHIQPFRCPAGVFNNSV